MSPTPLRRRAPSRRRSAPPRSRIRLIALSALGAAASVGCAGPFAGDLLARGQPVFGQRVDPAVPFDEALARKSGYAVERPEPGVLRIKGSGGGKKNAPASLELFFVGEGAGAKLVAAVLGGEHASLAAVDDKAKKFARRYHPDAPPLGYMARFGMIYRDPFFDVRPESYIAVGPGLYTKPIRFVMLVWDWPRFVERFGPIETRVALELRWAVLRPSQLAELPPDERAKFDATTDYSARIKEWKRARDKAASEESARRQKVEREERARREKAAREERERREKEEREAKEARERAERVAILRPGAAQRKARLASLYSELGRIGTPGSFDPGKWWGRPKQIVREIGELLNDDAIIAAAEGLPLTAASLRALGGHCRYLGGDPNGKLEMDRAAVELAARTPPYLEHIASERPVRPFSPRPMLHNIGEWLTAHLWDAFRDKIAKKRSGAIALSTRGFGHTLRRKPSSRWDEDKIPYQVEVTELIPGAAQLIAKREARLEEIGRLEAVHRDRLGPQYGDEAPSGIIQYGKYDPRRPMTFGRQGGGLSGSAAWRMIDAQQELSSLSRERVAVQRDIGRYSGLTRTRTVTRYRYVRKQLYAWEIDSANEVVARDPRGGRYSERQTFTGTYDADATEREATAKVVPWAKAALDQVGGLPTCKALSPLLRGRLAAAANAIKDPRESDLFLFYYAFYEPPKGWEAIVLGR